MKGNSLELFQDLPAAQDPQVFPSQSKKKIQQNKVWHLQKIQKMLRQNTVYLVKIIDQCVKRYTLFKILETASLPECKRHQHHLQVDTGFQCMREAHMVKTAQAQVHHMVEMSGPFVSCAKKNAGGLESLYSDSHESLVSLPEFTGFQSTPLAQ